MIEELVAAFNRGTLDVPNGLFTPKTAFSLNGRSYESILGGSPDDPLIRMLARGVGGYRTVAKALQYTLQEPVATIESISEPDMNGTRLAMVYLEGRLRDTGESFRVVCSLNLIQCDGQLAAVDLRCAEADLTRITDARR